MSMAVASVLFGCNGLNSEKKDNRELSSTSATEWTETQLLDTVQYQTFNYFWDGAEPNSGLARERIHMDSIYPTHDRNIITIGGSGFGLMAILVGVERDFITREQALERLEKAVNFLSEADRFHGAWP
ncbi:MAG: beta-glucosidase, partial [Flavobacteriaceae bacterium]|nr:beta-glucosidase [Flavobacteriaceae bacterium]